MEENQPRNQADLRPSGPQQSGKGDWNVPTGRRTDEWSECLVLIADKQDRAAYTRLFRHFAPLIKAFALSGSTLSATHADELVQEVMLKIWQKASAFNNIGCTVLVWTLPGIKGRRSLSNHDDVVGKNSMPG